MKKKTPAASSPMALLAPLSMAFAVMCHLSSSFYGVAAQSSTIVARDDVKAGGSASDTIVAPNSNNAVFLPPINDRLLESMNKSRSLTSGEWLQLGGDIDNQTNSYSYFGANVATSKDGSYIVIAAPNGSRTGLVVVYKYDVENGEYIQVGQDLVGKAPGDEFQLVDINDEGNMIIVGAPMSDGNGYSDNGQVLVFKFDDEVDLWVQLGQDLNGRDDNEWFGQSVAISGNSKRVAAGGPGYGGIRTPNGSIKVFEYNEMTEEWELLGQEIIGEGVSYLGSSLDMNFEGNVVVTGCPDNAIARVFKLEDNDDVQQWIKLGRDLEGGDSTQHRFGTSVAISADSKRIVIGGTSDEKGLVRVFEYMYYNQNDFEEWVQVGQDIPGEGQNDGFGFSVDMSDDGNMIVAGAKFNDVNGGVKVGHARVFQYMDNLGEWMQLGQDLNGLKSFEEFGYDVAISGDSKRVIVGVPGYEQVRVFYQQSLSCANSPLLVLVTGKLALSCTRISTHRRKDKFCQKDKIKSHCPNTCEVCEEYGSSDSVGTFIYKMNEANCRWVRGAKATISNLLRISSLCQEDVIRMTCRETCGIFVQECA